MVFIALWIFGALTDLLSSGSWSHFKTVKTLSSNGTRLNGEKKKTAANIFYEKKKNLFRMSEKMKQFLES